VLVCLEIIDTTYHSAIGKSHIFSLDSHLCIFVSMYLYIYIATHLQTIFLDWLKAVLESNSRCAWQWQWIEHRDTLWGSHRVSVGMHLHAVIKAIWRYIWRRWLSELRDALGDFDNATLEMPLKAMLVQTWRLNWARLEMHLEAMISVDNSSVFGPLIIERR